MLSGFPPCATTGVGSLPFTNEAEGFAAARELDIPWVPELIQLDPTERLIERALKAPIAPSAFLATLPNSTVVKTQIAGPTTLCVYGGLEPAAAFALIERHARAWKSAIFFFDEPALVTSEITEGTKQLIDSIHATGARVGLHCCGNTNWPEVLALPLDFIGLDVRRSLDAIVDDRRAWKTFVNRGGALALGVIPTDAKPAAYSVPELVEAIEATLMSTTPNFEAVIARSLLTPACGLGLATIDDARRITSELKQAQALLRARVGAVSEMAT